MDQENPGQVLEPAEIYLRTVVQVVSILLFDEFFDPASLSGVSLFSCFMFRLRNRQNSIYYAASLELMTPPYIFSLLVLDSVQCCG